MDKQYTIIAYTPAEGHMWRTWPFATASNIVKEFALEVGKASTLYLNNVEIHAIILINTTGQKAFVWDCINGFRHKEPKTQQQLQAEFMDACDMPRYPMEQGLYLQNGRNYMKYMQNIKLWRDLIQEEVVKELLGNLQKILMIAAAPTAPNATYRVFDTIFLTKIWDDCIDSIYVINGLMNCLGLDGDLGFKIVHEANMAKVGPDGKVIRREDGKILKPQGWIAPDEKLHTILSDQFEKIQNKYQKQEPSWQAEISSNLEKIRKLLNVDDSGLAMAMKNKDAKFIQKYTEELAQLALIIESEAQKIQE